MFASAGRQCYRRWRDGIEPSGTDSRPQDASVTGGSVRVPRSTYRLQVTPTWTLTDAAELVPQLHRLGADWVYLSPLLQSETGIGARVRRHRPRDDGSGSRRSRRVSPRVADAAHAAGHGCARRHRAQSRGCRHPTHSTWWWDVLRDGPQSGARRRRSTSTGTRGAATGSGCPSSATLPTNWTGSRSSTVSCAYYDQPFPDRRGHRGRNRRARCTTGSTTSW